MNLFALPRSAWFKEDPMTSLDFKQCAVPGITSDKGCVLSLSARSTLHQMQGTLQLETSGCLASGAGPESAGSYWQHQLLFGHLTGQFPFYEETLRFKTSRRLGFGK